MKILALPNSFKGSISARQTARVLARALNARHTVKAVPLSDGGDGFIDFFQTLFPAARRVRCRAKNAFLQTAATQYLWLPSQKTAVLETARICGLGTAPKEELDPLGASSYGVGEVLAHALKKGAQKIYIGLGGVACNDGGAGIAQALGARLLDKNGRALPPGAAPLQRLARIDLGPLPALLRKVQMYAVADVTNPLLGAQGSARVFGPQKGATPAQVRTLEKALTAYAQTVKKTTGRDIAHTPSTAAAGGLCAGLYGLLNAKMILGADFLQAHLPLDTWAAWADLIITCEGKLDTQTLFGKAPLAALQAAARHRKPALFICGLCEEKALKKLPKNLQLSVACLSDFALSCADSQRRAAHYIRQIARNI